MSEHSIDPAWAEVVYLLVARYRMPEPTEVVRGFREHLAEHGAPPPAIAAIRANVDLNLGDLASLTGGERSDEDIRSYFRQILRLWDS